MKILIFNYLIIFIIIIKQFGNIVKACTCLPSSDIDKYCRSDWAARVLIYKREEIPNTSSFENIHYTIKYLDIFKDKTEENSYQNQTDCIYTASQSAACGVDLKINKEYLLFGGYNNGIKNINLCGYFEKWNKVPNNLKEDLYNGEIGRNCTN